MSGPVWIVDDEPLIRAAMVAVLEEVGHTAEGFDTAEALYTRLVDGGHPAGAADPRPYAARRERRAGRPLAARAAAVPRHPDPVLHRGRRRGCGAARPTWRRSSASRSTSASWSTSSSSCFHTRTPQIRRAASPSRPTRRRYPHRVGGQHRGGHRHQGRARGEHGARVRRLQLQACREPRHAAPSLALAEGDPGGPLELIDRRPAVADGPIHRVAAHAAARTRLPLQLPDAATGAPEPRSASRRPVAVDDAQAARA